MNRVLQSAIIITTLGAMAAAQATQAPAPPAPTAPAVQARPARPATPAAPARPAKARSYLGVDIRDVTPDRRADLKLNEARGVEITMVDRDAPAGKVGLREHDVILSFNGRNIQNSEELRRLIRDTTPGQTVELGISRGGQAMTLKPQMADRRDSMVVHVPNIHVRIPKIDIPVIAMYPRRNGLVVENLTPQLGEVFGVKDGEGVLIRSVEADSPAAKAGLHAGDVIVRVGNEHVEGTSDWNRLMREQKPGAVQLGIVREKRQQTVTLAVPEHSREQSLVISGDDIDFEDYKNEMLELHRLQPEIERSMREAQEKVRREMERSQREMERSQREMERSRREAQREVERAQREAERAQERAQREQEKAAPPDKAPEPPKPPE